MRRTLPWSGPSASTMRSPADVDAILTQQTRAVGVFSEADVEPLPDPVQRYFRAAIVPGTPRAAVARLHMRGKIKLGLWLPFRAREVLAPHDGFVWAARVGGLIVGSDQYADHGGGMEWKLAGVVPVLRADSQDVARSSAERAGAEAFWLPTSLLPQSGVAWSADDDHHIDATFDVGNHPVHLQFLLRSDGRVQSLVLDRWGDPDNSGTWGLHRFGVEVTGYASFDGVSIPSQGRAGWHFGTPRWDEGFRYRITDLRLVT
jgi:hypothetical protein